MDKIGIKQFRQLLNNAQKHQQNRLNLFRGLSIYNSPTVIASNSFKV
jgi:hypothetical protein